MTILQEKNIRENNLTIINGMRTSLEKQKRGPNYRNANPKNYIKLIKVISRGGAVFRVGIAQYYCINGLIDYPFSNLNLNLWIFFWQLLVSLLLAPLLVIGQRQTF